MEDKKILNNEELEKVSGGTALRDLLQRDERQGWTSSGFPTDGITAAAAPDRFKCDLDINDSDITDEPGRKY